MFKAFVSLLKTTFSFLFLTNDILFENIIERIGASLVTDGDSKAFFKLVADLYEMGYLKSVNDHREQLVKLGFIATVVPENKSNIE